MSLVLGLDVSTSCTGICVIDSSITPDDYGSHIVYLDHVNLSKQKSFWSKADIIEKVLGEIRCQKKISPKIFSLEEPLLGFSKGMSSATTITTLMRFNGIVSYIGRKIFEIDPTYISAASARKLCGVKLQKTSVVGMSQKEQVFKFMNENDLKHINWDRKKSGQPIDAAKDMCDAYVIARAACLMNK